MGAAILNGLSVFFMETSYRASLDVGISLIDKKGILQTELTLQEQFARERLGMDARRASKWTADALTQAIYEVMLDLDWESDRTYPTVAQSLRSRHPDRAPKNGESLRKTVKLLGVNWKKIKAAAKKRSFR